MSFTIGTPQPGRPPKPDPWSALSALLKSMEIGESRTVPIIDSANTRNETGRQAITALRRYAAEQGCAIGLPGIENTPDGFLLFFTKKECTAGREAADGTAWTSGPHPRAKEEGGDAKAELHKLQTIVTKAPDPCEGDRGLLLFYTLVAAVGVESE